MTTTAAPVVIHRTTIACGAVGDTHEHDVITDGRIVYSAPTHPGATPATRAGRDGARITITCGQPTGLRGHTLCDHEFTVDLTDGDGWTAATTDTLVFLAYGVEVTR